MSSDVAMSLVRGIGAYMRAAEPRRLPAQLRSLRGFRPQTLLRHKEQLIAALEDDEDFRSAVLEWLDAGEVPLAAADQANLRLATERPKNWEQVLATATGDGEVEQPDRDPADAIAAARAQVSRDRARARRARADLKAARDEARRAVEEEAARAGALARQMAEVAALAEALQAKLDAARRDAERSVEDADRELRKARKAVTAAQSDATAARRELKVARRELAEASKRIESLERKLSTARGPEGGLRRTTQAPVRPSARRRRPLAVPPGRLPEDPQTLEEWLGVDGVLLLVDGYNVAKSELGYGSLPLEQQRERLIHDLRPLIVRKEVRAIIVFDGSIVAPGTSRRLRGAIAVEYSAPGETADDHLVALVAEAPPDPVVLVTNDRELQARAEKLGATIATSDQLLRLIR